MQTPPTNPPEPIQPQPVSPEVLAWAQQSLDVKEYLQGVREIETTGGRSFEALIEAVEAQVRES